MDRYNMMVLSYYSKIIIKQLVKTTYWNWVEETFMRYKSRSIWEYTKNYNTKIKGGYSPKTPFYE